MILQRFATQPNQRLGGDVGGHARVAVAVAADPRSVRHRRPADGDVVAVTIGDRAAEVVDDAGHGVPQHAFDGQAAVDLRDHRRLRRADEIGLPQFRQLATDGVPPVVGLVRRRVVVQRREVVADRRQFPSDAAPFGLRRVGGEDQFDVQRIAQRLHRRRVHAGRLERPHRRGDRFVGFAGVSLAGASSEHPDPFAILRNVQQVQEDAERPDQHTQFFVVAGGDERFQAFVRADVTATPVPGQATHVFDQLQTLRPGHLLDRLAEPFSDLGDFVPEVGQGVVGHVGRALGWEAKRQHRFYPRDRSHGRGSGPSGGNATRRAVAG